MYTTGILLLFSSLVYADQGGNDASMSGTTASTGAGGFPTKPLIFSTIVFEPYLMENTDPNAQGNDRYVGFIPDLVAELAERLQFDYELRLVRDGKWGARDQSTGQWNGMIGEVIRGEVDFAAAPLTVNDIRKSVVDFTTSWQDVSLTALVKTDSEVNSLSDLLQSNFTLGTISHGSTEKALMGSSESQISALWSRIMSNRNAMVQTSQEGRNKAKEGNYAYILEKPIANYYKAQDCGLETAGDFLPQAGYAFPAQKHYSQLNKFNQALGEMKRDGTIEALEDTWWETQPCSVASISIVSTSTMIIALFSALFYSLL